MANHVGSSITLAAIEVFQDARSRDRRAGGKRADQLRVNVGLVSAAVLAALTVATVSPERGASSAGCGQGAGGAGSYAYAGYQAASTAHGVRATITTLSIPNVGAGHVAAWIGVGGREQWAGRHGLVAPGRHRGLAGRRALRVRGGRSPRPAARAQDDRRQRRGGPGSPSRRAGDQADGRVGGASGSTARSRSRRSASSARSAAGSRSRPPSRGTATDGLQLLRVPLPGRRASPMREAARGARSRRGAASWTAATGCDGSSRRRRTDASARRSRSSRRASSSRPRYATILTGVPTRTTVRRNTMSRLCSRTQPCETAWPMSCGVFVPCTPTTPPPGQSDSFE